MDKESALEFARRSLRRSRDGIEPNAWLEGYRALVEAGETETSPWFQPDRIESSVQKARAGDQTAAFVLRTVVAELIKRGHPLPPMAREWAVEVITKSALPAHRNRRGRKSMTNFGRNNWITTVIDSLRVVGLQPTRNRETKTSHCGCSIVSETLAESGVHLSEQAVEKIWQQYAAFERSLHQ
jgi:hypothetical protein